MPALGELTEVDGAILQRPSSTGPFGAKGLGEMTANPPIGAIANAIFNATGVRIDHLPITPERVLRGIEALAANLDRAPSSPQKSDDSGSDGLIVGQMNNF